MDSISYESRNRIAYSLFVTLEAAAGSTVLARMDQILSDRWQQPADAGGVDLAALLDQLATPDTAAPISDGLHRLLDAMHEMRRERLGRA